MKRFLPILPLALLFGCASGPSLNGDWESSGGLVPATFKYDGQTAAWQVDAMGQTLKYAGKGQFDAGTSRLKLTEMKTDLPSFPMMPESAKKRQDEAFPAQATFSVSWKNKDEVLLTFEGTQSLFSGTYKRKVGQK